MIDQLTSHLNKLVAIFELLHVEGKLTPDHAEKFNQFQDFMATMLNHLDAEPPKFPWPGNQQALDAWQDWLEHRLSIGRPYKPVQLRSTLRHLAHIADGNADMFEHIIDAAIHKGYPDITANIRQLLKKDMPEVTTSSWQLENIDL
jgi:hypothetical protein